MKQGFRDAINCVHARTIFASYTFFVDSALSGTLFKKKGEKTFGVCMCVAYSHWYSYEIIKYNKFVCIVCISFSHRSSAFIFQGVVFACNALPMTQCHWRRRRRPIQPNQFHTDVAYTNRSSIATQKKNANRAHTGSCSIIIKYKLNSYIYRYIRIVGTKNSWSADIACIKRKWTNNNVQRAERNVECERKRSENGGPQWNETAKFNVYARGEKSYVCVSFVNANYLTFWFSMSAAQRWRYCCCCCLLLLTCCVLVLRSLAIEPHPKWGRLCLSGRTFPYSVVNLSTINKIDCNAYYDAIWSMNNEI